ncbi:MAG: oligosaccharide flippase family protein [Acutalibacteraceae bacterium]
MKNTKRLLINTLTLAATTFLMRTVGVAFNVYLTGRLGAAGIGLFSLVTDVYSMALTFSFAGLPLASTRLTVEDSGKDAGQEKWIMRRCTLYGLTVGCFMCLVVFAGADIIARLWLGDPRTASALRILAVSLPFASVECAFSGYFTARRTVIKYAAVQIIEQTVKIAASVAMLHFWAEKGAEYACDAVAVGMTVSQIVSLFCAVTFYKLTKHSKTSACLPGGLKALLHIAIPDAAGSCARSVLLTVEHLLIPVGFRKSGQSADQAMTLYGVIHGMALPVILYPAAIMTSLSSMLVPEFAECLARGDSRRIDSMAARAIKITVLFSMGTAGVMFIFSDGLSRSIYGDSQCTEYLKILAPLLPIMYTDTTVDGILKGLDQQIYSMRYNIIDSAMCVVLVCILIPKYSVKGYIAILFISEIVNFTLSIHRLSKVCRLEIDVINSIVKPVICVIASFLTGLLLVSAQSAGKLALSGIIALDAVVYISLLTLTGSISIQDISWFRNIFSKQNDQQLKNSGS